MAQSSLPDTGMTGASNVAGFGARLRPLVPDLFFGLLVIINTLRLFRHVMWRDELQAFMLAAASSTPPDIFAKLKYEGHPGLWHLLLWVITRFTTDPLWMQVAHLLIALGIWALIWRVSPFSKIEKLLLLLSYYLFWEYFVVSRSYALGVLLGFGFIALQTERPEQRFWPWVLLGLLANTSVFGTIWSLGLGVFFGGRNWREWRAMLGGTAVYAALVVLALATMIPAPDYQFSGFKPSFGLVRLDLPLRFAIGAFFPLFPPFVADALDWIGGWAADLAATPFGANSVDQLFLLLGGSAANQLPLLVALAVPILACLNIVRDRLLTLEFAVIYVGVLLFAQFSQHGFSPRHYGFVFVALIGVVWMQRSARLPRRPVALVWVALLVINTLGGLTSLAAGLRPFSQSRNAATWLERKHLDGAFLMGAQDYAASPIAGYLQRPLYYLNCECFGTYVEWSSRRQYTLDLNDIVTRVARGMETENKNEAYLILNTLDRLGRQNIVPDLAFEPIKRFPSAIVGDETYVIYRVSTQSAD